MATLNLVRSDSARGEGRGLRAPALLLWCALAAGTLEAAWIAWHRAALDGVVRASPHVYWLSVLSYLSLFAVVGALAVSCWIIGRRWTGRGVTDDSGADRAGNAPLVGTCAALVAFGMLAEWEGLHDAAALVLAAGLGVLAARVAADSRRFQGLVRRTMLPLALMLLVVAGSSLALDAIRTRRALESIPAPARADPPNILLIILDTVRAGSLSLYGYEHATSPNLERFARTGVTFDRAISTSPWTLPSHGSMFTGRYPHELGVGFFQPLDDRHPTLAESMSSLGYETVGFVGNLLYGAREYGLSRGFARYEDYRISPGQVILSSAIGRRLATSTALRRLLGWHQLVNRKTARSVTRDFLSWLEDRRPERPFFAFLNYFDAHEPYLPGSPYDRMFGSESLDRPLWHYGGLREGNEARRSNEWLEDPGDPWLDRRAYEAAIAELDAEFGRLMDELERRDALHNTIVIVTADHGELLGEHELFYHWNSLYLPALHVPLIVRDPEMAGGERVARPVSLIDLPATIFDLADLPNSAGLPGVPLLDAIEVPPPPDGVGSTAVPFAATSPVVLSELELGPTFSIVEDRYHYIVQPGSRHEQLYDLARDPAERENLASHPDVAELLRRLRDRTASEIERPRPPGVSY